MGKFELAYIYPYVRDKKITYLRNVFDLIFIWIETELELLSFIKDLNKKNTPPLNSILSTQKQRIIKHKSANSLSFAVFHTLNPFAFKTTVLKLMKW